MALIDANRWVLLVREALGHGALWESNPALVWHRPSMSAALARVEEALGQVTSGERQAAAKKAAAKADKVHDDGHRHFYKLLDAYCFGGTAAERAAVEAVIPVLYPNGLRIVSASYADEAAAGLAFAERLKREDVQQALRVIAENGGPSVYAKAEACVGNAARIADILRRMEALRVQAVGSAPIVRLFDSIRQASVEWKRFYQNVEMVYEGPLSLIHI